MLWNCSLNIQNKTYFTELHIFESWFFFALDGPTGSSDIPVEITFFFWSSLLDSASITTFDTGGLILKNLRHVWSYF